MPDPKRPRDTNQLAKMVVDIAAGEQREATKNQSAAKAGTVGGAARARVLTPEQRSEIAKVAAEARWRKAD